MVQDPKALQTSRLPPRCQNSSVPYVNVQITRGATREQKAEIVRDITRSLVEVFGKRPEHIHVVIQEITEEDWGFAGQLTDDWKKTSDLDTESLRNPA